MPNALLAIPVYWGLAFAPHVYSMQLISQVDRKAYDNTNPRGRGHLEGLRKVMGPERFARWERTRSAHANGLEALPLFAAAMLAGVIAHVPGTEFVAGLNLVVRFIYNFLYISTTTRRRSFLRTASFLVMTAANIVTLLRAGMGSF